MKKQMFVALLVLVSTAILTLEASGAVRVEVGPGLPGGIPAYARTDFGIPFHTEEWAAIVFYRDPACVPTTFNLLDFVDIPAAFGCPLTMAGFEIWQNGPPPSSSDPQPIFSESHGLGAVPVWFVSWPALQEQIEDGVLRITDLLSMDSLQVGSADFFQETHQVQPALRASHLGIVASGHLADGRSFQIEFLGVLRTPQDTAPSVRSIRIEFK